ncbi:alkaline phosphatase D family protein [Rhodopseudomonas pseudopalustris]|uniref:Alkaline phosphatase D n=1 Tax=Rhodopseudomonas pseudopalustris TaxID=1513892 RepID=A0A1H8LMC5_9BRAD|nr:alkaline phosphatase D family protein [Rhodopseudomonas pseudopalustris]SEO06163.1 alkaline phosphatase D [Rhodopseudomonas pseudopalustris]
MSRQPLRSGLSLDRRTLLRGAIGAGLAGTLPSISGAAARTSFKSDPFTLGIASGDPAPDGFVLWTRLAPEPLEARGGMTAHPVEVTVEIAHDPAMSRILRTDKAIAHLELAHSVHVEVEGLSPARDYFYRFRAGDAESPIGRARTLPPPDATPAQLRFVAAGCQRWEGGYYTAWRAIADDQLDFVFHYGDYIYEYAFAARDKDDRPNPRTMPPDFPACFTLTDYRRRYALYKGDPDLQAAHASCPFLSSFDDHEIANNWASDSDPKQTPAAAFLFRRAMALQAWYEHMPVRRALIPRGPDVLAYRGFRIGTLADIAVLDTRQYRSRQPCGDGFRAHCDDVDAADRTMLGAAQERWLAERLKRSKTVWQVLAQQVLFAQFDWRGFPWAKQTDGPLLDMDTWNGADAARDRVMAMLAEANPSNPVVLTGDLHRALAFELRRDWRDPNSPRIGVEFVSSSISSPGDGPATGDNLATMYKNNPNLKFFSDQRGYTRHEVTRSRWQADVRVVDDITARGQPVRTARTLLVEAGRPGLLGN